MIRKKLRPPTIKEGTNLDTSSAATSLKNLSQKCSNNTKKATTAFDNQERKQHRPSSNVPPVIHLHSQEESDKKESGTSTQKTSVEDPTDLTDLPASPNTKSPSTLITFKSSDNNLVNTAEVSYTHELNKCQEHVLLYMITRNNISASSSLYYLKKYYR
eukprot:2812173-Ditylum_brightwellii.AAC.1